MTSIANMAPRVCRWPVSARLDAFRRDEDGSFVVFALFFFLAIMMVSGLSVDLMRHEYERAQLQANLDRAVLAAADRQQTQDAETVVYNYLETAGLQEHIESIDVYEDIAQSSVSASVRYDTSTMFMRMSGVESLPVIGVSTAEESVQNIEVSLVLDISKSMDSTARIGALKPAAKEFVATILDTTVAATTVNLVPFGGTVNPGRTMFDYMGGVKRENPVNYDGTDDFAWHDVEVGGTRFASLAEDMLLASLSAVQNVSQGLDDDGDLILPTFIPETHYHNVYIDDYDGRPHNYYCNAGDDCYIVEYQEDIDDPVLYPDTNCVEFEDADYSVTTLHNALVYEQVPHFDRWHSNSDNRGYGWCPDDNNTIQYAQTSSADLGTFIDQMILFDGTGTEVGMKYGLGLLDPASQTIFDHLRTEGLVPVDITDRPAEFDDPETVKYIVLMADGGTTSQQRPRDYEAVYNLYNLVEANDRRRDRISKNSARDYLQDQCDLAAENGVIVFTIGFHMTQTWAITDLKDCASSPSHYFPADESTIADTFQTIARDIQELQLLR